MAKTIVITGAGSGLGRALALRFAADGEKVVLLGRTAKKIEEVAESIGNAGIAVRCDVSDPVSVREAFATISDRCGEIDVLINNAAIFEPSTIAGASDDHIVNTINTNLTGPVLCSRSAIPMLRAGGHIINISSESVDTPFPMLALYQASKAGLERFSRSLHEELDPKGIKVTNLRAGQMHGDAFAWAIEPEILEQFYNACLKAGVNLGERPLSRFESVADLFRALIDLPSDVQVEHLRVHARAVGI